MAHAAVALNTAAPLDSTSRFQACDGDASGQAPMFSPAPSCDTMKTSEVAPGGQPTRHGARLGRFRLCARLYRTFVRGRELWGPDAAIRSRRAITALHLSALAR